MEGRAYLEGQIASLSEPVRYSGWVEFETERGTSRIELTGSPDVFRSGRIFASDIRGNLANVNAPDLDLQTFGVYLPRLYVSDRIDARMDLQANGLNNVTGWLRAAPRNLNLFGQPVSGVDGTLSVQMAVDLTRGDITINSARDSPRDTALA